MKYAIVLGFGILIGFLIGHMKDEPVKIVEVQKPILEKKVPQVPQAKYIKVEPSQSTVHITQPIHTKTGRIITLSSQLVGEMEDRRNDLRQEIRLKQEQDGWRILELQNNSLFSKAGFIQGDLITTSAVESLRYQEPGREDLPGRFFKILSHVTD